MVGGPEIDQLRGTPARDVIVGLAGNDKIEGGEGGDLICAGGGTDIVSAGTGGDQVSGGDGADQLLGGDGRDGVIGGRGVDGCKGGGGKDVVRECEASASRNAKKRLRDEAPSARPDSVTLAEDAPSTMAAVLANDPDPDRGPKAVRSVGRPRHGTSTIDTDRTAVSYAPNPNFCGEDSFAYTLNGGSTASVTVSVACVDDQPVAVADSFDVSEDAQAAALPLFANDTDIDGGPIRVTAKGDPQHGTLGVGEGGGAIGYSPAPDYCGPDSFAYMLNGGSTADVSVRVACVDDPPVAVADSFELSQEDDLATLPVLANDSDVDGPATSISEVTQPEHGTAAIVDGGNTLEYRPQSGYCNQAGESETFDYVLSGGTTASVQLSVECLAGSTGTVTLAGTPILFPSFDRAVDDYVVRCDGGPMHLTATLEPGYMVSVDGQPEANGTVEVDVPVQAGQEFAFDVFHGQGRHRYFVRCLPADFPAFSVAIDGPRQAEWYVVSPTLFVSPPDTSDRYVALFDNNGVPVWWFRTAGPHVPLDAKLLPNGNVSWLYYTGGGAEERSFDGSLVRMLDTAEGTADHHEILLLSNGNYLLERYPERPDVDMTSCGGSASRTLLDSEIQELTPAGSLVWSWSASDHIPLSEVPSGWTSQCTGNGDAYHLNSVEPDGDGYVISFRHLDAVYRIDRDTGDVDWKLGGVPRAESLTVIGDPLSALSTFGGQHDARILGDGTLTVFDDGTLQGRPPRSLRFSIDAAAGTATLLEDVRDATTPDASCCGSTRRLPAGNWVTSWGSNPYVTEQTPDGARVFTLTFTQGFASYRAQPLPPGEVTPAELRAGMDVQFPR